MRVISVTISSCFQVISSGDVKHLDMLISRHQSIFSHLYKRASEDQAYDVSDFNSTITFLLTCNRVPMI